MKNQITKKEASLLQSIGQMLQDFDYSKNDEKTFQYFLNEMIDNQIKIYKKHIHCKK